MSLLKDLPKLLRSGIRRYDVPGASLAIHRRGRRYEATAGVLNLETGVKVTPDSVFQIGSITKIFTTTLIMQLVDEGLIDLDTPIRQYLPGFRVADRQATRTVTPRHFLSHTSGIEGDFFVDSGRGDDCIRRLQEMGSMLPNLFPPGERISYCNFGFAMLGRIIEVATGRSWDQAIRQRLFEPLGMRHALTLPEDTVRYRAAIGHLPDPRNPRSNLVSMGIYVFNKDILCQRLIEDARLSESPHDFGYAIIPNTVRRDKAYAYKFDGYWQDIGTVESYYQANMELTRRAPSFSLDDYWPILTHKIHSASLRMSEQGSVRNSLISSGCLIKGEVENSVLSTNVVIEEQAVVRDSVILADTCIGYHSVINRCILDEGVNIGEYCYIGFGHGLIKEDWNITVLGRRVLVPPNTAIGCNCRILPNVGPDDFTSNAIPSGSIISKKPRQQSNVRKLYDTPL